MTNKNFSVLIVASMLVGYIPAHSQEASLNMTPDEVVAVLKKGPENWFSWCRIVKGGTNKILVNNKVQDELLRLLDRISLARDKVFSDPMSKFPGKSKQKWSGECEGECYGCLDSLEKVVAAQHNERTLKSLIAVGSSSALDFGERAVLLIISRYHSTNWMGRGEMLGLMGEIFERGIGTEDMREEVKALVFDAAVKDADIDIRDTAIRKLHHFGKEEALRILKEISETDSYSYMGKKSKKKIYPVRDSANNEIERLSKPDSKP